MKKRMLGAFILIIVLLCSSVAVAGFTDLDAAADGAAAVYKMQEKGYIKGFEDGSFKPNNSLTRAEFVTIINKMYGFTALSDTGFSDVYQKDWFYNDVMAGVKAGYIKGMGNGIFKPNAKVTREQVCVMLNSVLKTEKLPYDGIITDKVSDWARESVEKLLSNRLFMLEEGGKFRATEPITRLEVCVALEKCIVEVTDNFDAFDVSEIADEEIEKRLLNIAEIMETKVVPECSAEDNKLVATMIVDNLRKYAEDSTYDYKAGTKATFKVYQKVPKERRDELRGHIYKYVDTQDLMLFYEIFYNSDIDSVIWDK